MSSLEPVRELGFAAGVLLGRPFSCLLQVTNRCNMRCSFCDFWPNGVTPSEEMSLADYASLESQLWKLGRFLVSIEGGEPFARDDLMEIVELFGRRHLPVLYTNGWHVDEGTARGLYDAGLTQAGVSIDYADPARHDAKRGLAGAAERAWSAVRLLRDAAPRGGSQVHVMTVLMEDNSSELERLFEISSGLGVGHCVTLLATKGFRRRTDVTDRQPPPETARTLLELWERHGHLRVWRDYLSGLEPYLTGGAMPTCRAGRQSFNVDHVGNVSPCIEKLDRPCGNVRETPLASIVQRMANLEWVESCQDCWTLCRGLAQNMGGGGTLAGWRDTALRMRSF